MYCNKENVNILTSLLPRYGVAHAVLCPGSRNAPIVHNLNECPAIACHPVTDERSAGFYALGLALATATPVVVCVTSGSALLNVAPAVAEAFYRHVPLVVVSADRPQQWIGQLDGQTMWQTGALCAVTRRSVCLPEPTDAEGRWHCSRLVNEALLAATAGCGEPVHVNVPVSEPLFGFTTAVLPDERQFRLTTAKAPEAPVAAVKRLLEGARRPMIVMGQTPHGMIKGATMRRLRRRMVVIAEPLANASYETIHADEAVELICRAGDGGAGVALRRSDYEPDRVVYIGGTVVSKRVRRFLRESKAPSCIVVSDVSDAADPLMSLTDIVECRDADVDTLLQAVADMPPVEEHAAFAGRWNGLLDACQRHADEFVPQFSQMAVVRYFEQQLDDFDADVCVHYANSNAIRLANIYAAHYVWCNRGINGIEGSLSTAAGFSLATDDIVACVIGDLSFFYDQNALWCQNLRGNLRIILLNNGGGGIFRQLDGLGQSPAADSMIAAVHSTTAQGVCTQNDVGYMAARNADEMRMGIVTLLTRQTSRPMLLEVFTDAGDDAAAVRHYLDTLEP